MARDNYHCFMCGYPDAQWFRKHHPKPADKNTYIDDCDPVPIIQREAVLAQDVHIEAHEGVGSGGEVRRSSRSPPSRFVS